MNEQRYLADEAATLAFGAEVAAWLREPRNCCSVVFLKGQLGAGKTTLVRGILRAFGYQAAVKSPTYTLLEPYEELEPAVYHFDFYRVGDSEELDFIGLDELLDAEALKFIEWPEQAAGRLPVPDLEITLTLDGAGRQITLTQPGVVGSARGD
jgi:tRNA threonylcarbamoyladenosine biosynthesis protein TsaE